MSESGQSYIRPPITEAVIELRCDARINEGLLSKVNKRFEEAYPGCAEQKNFHVNLNADNRTGEVTASVQSESKGYRRSADDAHDILVLNPNSIAVAQYAPYPGWGDFFNRTCRDFRIWRDAGVSAELSRIGMRYVNRIDIPEPVSTEPLATVNTSDYVKLALDSPAELGPTLSYALNGSFLLSNIQSIFQINSGVVLPPPIPRHLSILLDIDIWREIDVPQAEYDVVHLLMAFRKEKNRIFELIVTDKARELFN